MDAYQNCLEEWRGDRREAFKRIQEAYRQPRRRTKEMLKWLKAHPSPMHPAEQLRNLKRALFSDI